MYYILWQYLTITIKIDKLMASLIMFWHNKMLFSNVFYCIHIFDSDRNKKLLFAFSEIRSILMFRVSCIFLLNLEFKEINNFSCTEQKKHHNNVMTSITKSKRTLYPYVNIVQRFLRAYFKQLPKVFIQIDGKNKQIIEKLI